jgi:DNA-binding transcriptional MerR regulator
VSHSANFIAAFSEEHVERLTGLSKTQLRYWDRTGFFLPSYADDNRRSPYSRIYSFSDLLALRTLGVLRKQYSVPLQHLRKVAERLSHLESRLWTATSLYVVDKKVIFHEQGTKLPREIVSGQFLVPIELQKVVIATQKDVSKLRERRGSQIGVVERSRSVNRNAPVVAGTRIPIAAIRRFKEAGYTVSQIIAEYPDLKPKDVEAALSHGARAAA